jgi:hypothetical protein
MRLYAEPINDTPGIPSVILTVNRVDQFLSNTGSFSGSFTGNLIGTATTASYISGSVFTSTNAALSASYALSSSFSTSASFAQTSATASILSGFDPNAATFTIELIDALTVDFYAPDDLRINTTSSISGSVTASLSVNNSAYTLTNLINQGNKITVTAASASVFNLNAKYE